MDGWLFDLQFGSSIRYLNGEEMASRSHGIAQVYLLTYLLTYLLIHSLTYSLHGAAYSLKS